LARFCLLALTNCLPGQDVEFNRWYDEQHTHDVVAVPGIESAQRFKVLDSSGGQLTWRYLTLYELSADDPAAVLQELGNRMGTAVMPSTEALDMTTAGAVVLEAVGEKVTTAAKLTAPAVAGAND
jgi:hypothetical protein